MNVYSENKLHRSACSGRNRNMIINLNRELTAPLPNMESYTWMLNSCCHITQHIHFGD